MSENDEEVQMQLKECNYEVHNCSFPCKPKCKFASAQRKYFCQLCGDVSKKNLELHLELHYSVTHLENKSEKDIYCCNACHEIKYCFEDMKDHWVESHFGKLCCNKCGKLFNDQNTHDQHIETHHNAQNSHGHIIDIHKDTQNCGTTDKQFDTVSRKPKNKKLIKKVKCKVCSKTFKTNEILHDHIIRGACEKPFWCSICGRTFSCLNGLSTHAKTCVGADLPFDTGLKKLYGEAPSSVSTTCPEIKTYSRVKTFSSTSKKLFCQLCGNVLTSKAEIKRHLELHYSVTHLENNSDKNTYCCNVCHEIRYCFEDMKDHWVESHLGKLCCDKCGKLFNDQNTHDQHIETHNAQNSHDHNIDVHEDAQNSHDHTIDVHEDAQNCGTTDKQFDTVSRKPKNKKRIKRAKCKVCFKIFKSNEVLRYHIIRGACEKPFWCSICGRTFSRQNGLSTHAKVCVGAEIPFDKGTNILYREAPSSVSITYPEIKTYSKVKTFSSTSKKLFCQLCSNVLTSKAEIQRHLELHYSVTHLGNNSDKNTYCCNTCHEIRYCFEDMKDHWVESHFGKLCCDKCGKLFNDQNTHDQHIETHNAQNSHDHNIDVHEDAQNCGTTDKQFDTVSRKPKNKNCIKRVKCKVCSKTFKSNKVLRDHIIRGACEKPFWCSICGRTFSRQNGLSTHAKVCVGADLPFDTGERKLYGEAPSSVSTTCPEIKTYSRVKTFSSTSKKLFCQLCGNVLTSEAEIQRHLELHYSVTHLENNSDKNTYCCNTCHEIRYCFEDMKDHWVESHFGKLCCNLCGKIFDDENSLDQHADTHENAQNSHDQHVDSHQNAQNRRISHTHFDVPQKPRYKKDTIGRIICWICYEIFQSEKALYEHTIRGACQRPFSCAVCGSSFSRKSGLVTHTKVCVGGCQTFDQREEILYGDQRTPEKMTCPRIKTYSKVKRTKTILPVQVKTEKSLEGSHNVCSVVRTYSRVKKEKVNSPPQVKDEYCVEFPLTGIEMEPPS